MEFWMVLVPTEKPKPHGKDPYFSLRHHRVWDKFVEDLTGGLTILNKVKGRWISPEGEAFFEANIPVSIACNKEQIDKIASFTIKHYNQLAVMYYKISDQVYIKHRGEKESKIPS